MKEIHRKVYTAVCGNRKTEILNKVGHVIQGLGLFDGWWYTASSRDLQGMGKLPRHTFLPPVAMGPHEV